MRTWQL